MSFDINSNTVRNSVSKNVFFILIYITRTLICKIEPISFIWSINKYHSTKRETITPERNASCKILQFRDLPNCGVCSKLYIKEINISLPTKCRGAKSAFLSPPTSTSLTRKNFGWIILLHYLKEWSDRRLKVPFRARKFVQWRKRKTYAENLLLPNLFAVHEALQTAAGMKIYFVQVCDEQTFHM